MNRRSLFQLTAVGALTAGIANVASGHAAPRPDDVAASVEDLRRAMLSGKALPLNRIISSRCSWGHSNGVIQTREEFVQAVTSRAEVFETLEFQDRDAFVVDGIGVARHTFVSDVRIGGKVVSLRLGELEVWCVERGSLRCVARQAYAA